MTESAFPLYQTHDDLPAGMSDSRKKLARLMIPQSLAGKSVLDIGCNEGWFCNLCVQRGARRVVGIDFDKPRIEFAKKKYAHSNIEFIYQKWDRLPDGPFDFVLWTSAMHYELNPQRVFNNIFSVMSPAGLFILECGTVESDLKEMRIVQRHSDTQYYPTTALLRSLLNTNFDFREQGLPEAPIGDPIPRRVFHCTRRAPAVVVVSGTANTHNSRIIEGFRRSGAKEVNVLSFVHSIASAQYHHSELQKTLKDEFGKHTFNDLLSLLASRNLMRDLVESLLKTLNSDDDLAIVRVDADFDLLPYFKEAAGQPYVFWTLHQASTLR